MGFKVRSLSVFLAFLVGIVTVVHAQEPDDGDPSKLDSPPAQEESSRTEEAAAPAAERPPAAPQSAAEEIVVTARRREETIMDVPVVLSSHSREAIERYETDSLQSIGELTPTVIVANYKTNGGGSIAVRGISTPGNQVGFEQAVSVAIDGVQSSNGHIAQLGFFDMERVEILKGPQALFFGKNNTAGVISIISAGPTGAFEAGTKMGYEFEAEEVLTEAYVSGPLTETLGARLAVRYRSMDGWLTNTARPIENPFYNAETGAPSGAALLPGTSDDTPGEEEVLGRLTLQYQPSDAFNATLRTFIAQTKDDGAGVASQNIGPCTGPDPRVNGIADPFGECKVDDRTTIGAIPPEIAETQIGAPKDGKPFGELDANIVSLDAEYDLGNFALSWLTGYSTLEYQYYSGLDQTTFSQLTDYEEIKQDDISQEIRLSSEFESPLNFLLGFYYQDSESDVFIDAKVNDGFYNEAENRFSLLVEDSIVEAETRSVFGQVLWDITETVSATAGARWTQVTKDFHKQSRYGFGSFDLSETVFPGESRPGVLTGKFEDNNVSPEITLRWQPSASSTIFAAYKTGFKSGGFGLTNPIQQSSVLGDIKFDSETVKGFEVGSRSILMEGRLTLNAAVFYYDFKDLQVNIYDPNRIAFTINNAGKVQQRGAELEGSFQATEILSLHGAVSYVNNEYKDFTGQCYSYRFPTGATRETAVPPPNCSFVDGNSLTLQQVFDGRTPARSPDWSGNVGFSLEKPVAAYSVALTGDALYRGSYHASDTLVAASHQDEFFLFNAGVSLGDVNDAWRLSLLGRNLSDEYYVLYAVDRTGGAGVPGAIGEQRGVVSRGREVILQMQMNF